jgi:bla regulator protein blaR1
MLSRRILTTLQVAAIVLGLGTADPVSSPHAQAQQSASATRPAFEVASVKRSSAGPGPIRIETLPGGRFVATNASLRALIQYAYRLQPFQIAGGPAWLASDRYDIVAKADAADGDRPTVAGAGGPTRTQLMVQTLLGDRFKLVIHTESRELQIYALVQARGDGRLGSALSRSSADCRSPAAAAAGSVVKGAPAAGDGNPCGLQLGLGSLTAGGVALSQIATALSGLLDRSVVDRTGLAGAFDATLRWTPDESTPGMAQKAKFVPTIDPNGPSIFTALQEQLGLKLEPAKGPVDVLVVVNAQPPSPN